MTTPHSERACPRYEVHTDCMALAESGQRLVGDRLADLSWDGAFVQCEPNARVGERLRLSLRVPDSQLWIDARATVARVSHGRRGSGDRRGLGLRITAMDGMSRILLATVAKKYPAAQRGPGRDNARIVARIAGG